MKKHHHIASAAALLTGLLLSSTANAQLAGQHINPNVTILLDTGRGMNWTKTASMSEESDVRTNQAESLCENMNKQDYSGDLGTTWQLVLQALLGTVPDKYDHCFYEEAGIRPTLMSSDTIDGLDNTITSVEGDFTSYMKKLTAEYWEFSREPHFRLINCRDPRQTSAGGRGDWNTTYNQCIGTMPDDALKGEDIVTDTGRRYWCAYEVNGQKNLYTYSIPGLTQKVCLNLNPLAQDRHTDGILEQHRTLARFSLMTFDNLPAPARSYWDSTDSSVKQTTPWDVLDAHRSGWDYGRDVRWFITAY
ncbi:MAG: hypothetical protein JXX14_13120, partial [Deltaproteobacteria bacterium]|nr:hypothetical protein [Deltaproteobacteria bacterium]